MNEFELRRKRPRKPPADELSQAVGFGLSGGGIRSATFCLGVFQALASRPGLLHKIDYISSVSGGSFFAAFYGRLFSRPDIKNIGEVEKILSPDQGARHSFTDPADNWKTEIFRWLRENGRYLAPNGSGDLLIGITVLLRNWITVQLLLSISLLALFLFAQLVRDGLREFASRFATPLTAFASPATQWFWVSPYIYVPALMAIFLVAIGWSYWTFALPDPGTMTAKPEAAGQPKRKLDLAAGLQITAHGLGTLLAFAVVLLAVSLIANNFFDHSAILWKSAAAILETTFFFWQLALLRSRVSQDLRARIAFAAILLVSLAATSSAIDCYQNISFSDLRTFSTVLHAFFSDGWLFILFSVILFLILPFACALMTPKDLERPRKLVNQSEMARTKLSAWLKTAFIITLAAAAFAILDSLGQFFYALTFAPKSVPTHWLVVIIGGITAIVPFARWITSFFTPKKGRGWSPSLSLLAAIGALLVYLPFLVSIDGMSHAIAYGFAAPSDAPPGLIARYSKTEPPAYDCLPFGSASGLEDVSAQLRPASCSVSAFAPATINRRGCHYRDWRAILGYFILAALFSLLTGSAFGHIAWTFLNRTSLHSLYCGRLVRAYLGASNKYRQVPNLPVLEARAAASKRKGTQVAMAKAPDGDRDHNSPAGVSDPIDGDDIPQAEYWRPLGERFWHAGAPLHLVNVTINETIDGQSQTEQRDRKGVGMAMGPSGLSVGVQHHVVIGPDPGQGQAPIKVFPRKGDGFRVFAPDNGPEPISYDGERLSLGKWTAISGAAVATGLGSRNSLGASLLTGFFNVRLGYWWDSGTKSIAPGDKLSRKVGKFFARLLPVQSSFLDEFLGRFRGTARRYWYLTDGGHFENMGGYELIRRRLPLIVLIDCGADSNYDFEDLANLIRKARLDFNADIKFLDPDAAENTPEGKEFASAATQASALFNPINKQFFGTIEQLRRGKWAEEPIPDPKRQRFFKSSNPDRLSVRHAALATIKYLDDPYTLSYLVLLKPSLIGEEPQDLLNYHSAHPDFPQETTAEQFFNEAQWESYRRLGQHITERVFQL
ncbi:MAG: patatin-like phospholipase family protein [Candidatus Binataceae bacterium]